jgi:hypothetical protein
MVENAGERAFLNKFKNLMSTVVSLLTGAGDLRTATAVVRKDS